MDKNSILKIRHSYKIGRLHMFEMKDSLEYLTNHEDSVNDKPVTVNLNGQKYSFMTFTV